MDDGSITLLAALIILVAFSAFFSASETAFSSLNQIRLKSRAEDGDSAAARVLAMSEKYDKLLSTILIGNNIVNIAAASIGTVLFTRLLDPERGATVSTFVLTIVVLIFGEVTPKSLAKEMPETVATAVSPFLNLLLILFTPLTWLFTQWKRLLGHFIHSTEEDTITEGELMTMVSEAENDGELTDRESQLIRSAIEFDDVEVEEILTPRVDVIAVEDDLSLDEVADTFAESGYSRLPVYHGTIDNIIGVVHEKDFYLGRLRKDTTLEDLVKPTLYTTGSTQISQLLRTLREQHHHMAVVDSVGKLMGRLTIDEIVDVVYEETDNDLRALGGISAEDDVHASVGKAVKTRWAWLAINLCTAFVASRVIDGFEHTISQLVALASLMPIVAGIGGNTGNQTITMIVRALALENIQPGNFSWLIFREMGVALINGLVWGGIMGGITWWLYDDMALGGVMMLAMVLNLLVAAMMGVIIPLTMTRLGRDPAVGSSVMITAITDTGGFFIFLGLATIFLL